METPIISLHARRNQKKDAQNPTRTTVTSNEVKTPLEKKLMAQIEKLVGIIDELDGRVKSLEKNLFFLIDRLQKSSTKE